MTQPRNLHFNGWKGNRLTTMDFHETAEKKYPGTWFGDFHRADLHRCLYDRVLELGGIVSCNSRVVDLTINDKDGDAATATAVMGDGREITADLIVAADGVFSGLRDLMLGRHDPPVKTGDLAYRVLLDTKEMLKYPDLAELVREPQVNYWLGPDAHAVNYVLRRGQLFNMVLLVPDDIPDGGKSTVDGDVEEMCSLVKGWDIRYVSKVGSLLYWSNTNQSPEDPSFMQIRSKMEALHPTWNGSMVSPIRCMDHAR